MQPKKSTPKSVHRLPLSYSTAASAYHQAGLTETAQTYDRLADAEFENILASLQAAAVPDEPNPVKIDWNC